METTDFDWLNGNWALDLEILPPDSPRAGTAVEAASQAGERVDQTGSELALPLLRLSGWEADQQYDKNNPVYIHYDFRWKISQCENIRAKHICSNTDPNLVLAPSDFWKVNFETRLETLLQNEDKFPRDIYICEETIIEISIEQSCQCGLSKRYPKLEINWQKVDKHLKGLGDLFSKKKKIIFDIEFVYKKVTSDFTTAKGKKKKKNVTEA